MLFVKGCVCCCFVCFNMCYLEHTIFISLIGFVVCKGLYSFLIFFWFCCGFNCCVCWYSGCWCCLCPYCCYCLFFYGFQLFFNWLLGVAFIMVFKFYILYFIVLQLAFVVFSFVSECFNNSYCSCEFFVNVFFSNVFHCFDCFCSYELFYGFEMLFSWSSFNLLL